MAKWMESWQRKRSWERLALVALLSLGVLGSALVVWCGGQPTHLDLRRTVWINALDPYYHIGDCDYLAPEASEVMIGDALSVDRKPCPVCKPGGPRISWISKRWKGITQHADVQAALVAILGSIVSVAMVVVTARNVHHTRRAAEAANRNADYTREYVESSRQNVELTKGLVEEARIQRLDGVMPVVAINWDREPGRGHFAMVIKNSGSGAAVNVKARFKIEGPLEGLGLPTEFTAPVLGAGDQFATYLPSTYADTTYHVAIEYEDLYGRAFRSRMVARGQVIEDVEFSQRPKRNRR